MTINKSIQFKTASGKNVEVVVEVTHKVMDNIVDLDGDKFNLGKKTYDSMGITLIVDGKKALYSRTAPKMIVDAPYNKSYKELKEKGVYARMGDTYIGEEIYKNVMAAIAQAEAEFNDTEYAEVKAAEIAREKQQEIADQTKAESDARDVKSGLCPKCGTYCYGDCEAN